MAKKNKKKKTFEDFSDHYEMDGKKRYYFREEKALAYLLRKGICFLNSRPYVENPWDPKGKWEISEKSTTVVFVNCNDLFAWGSADGEEVAAGECVNSELANLLRHVLDDPVYGTDKWCCKKRNEKPQKPIEEKMREGGHWDDEMEKLPDNYYWANLKKRKEEKENESEVQNKE